ncbi:porin [Paraburkholderia lycopersici]|uniref:Outer membrane protein (Porin) n=1 Tax=Paraburkholderia lycopersici TaxID=416944 RepID=A0A1G6PJH4_9BURK|nr:porin [Paraburkholderia lycopersici]SDC79567.1 Outer membrane protein (porin) [Paraburkholderia lycopersici]
MSQLIDSECKISKFEQIACIARKIVTASLVILSMAPALARAQSSVTLFGSLDEAIEYLTNSGKTSHSVVQAAAAEIYANAIGLKGVEDLGGGIKAIFRLEGGISPNTGASLQGGRLFGRQAWVGLQNDNNKVVFGRVYTPLYDVIGYLDPLQGSNVSLWSMDGGFVSRMDNAVRYTRTDGPFHENLQYSFGSDGIDAPLNGVAGGEAKSKEYSVAADYTTDQLMAAVVYDYVHGPMTSAQYGMSLYVPSLVPAAPVSPERAERLATALRYTWGGTSVFAGYRHLKTEVQGVDHDSNLYWTGLTERITPAWVATAGVYHERVAGIDARPTLVALQTQYFLSKATGLYANVAKVWNTKLSDMGVDLQTQTSTGAGQLGASIGLFHFF